MVEKKSEKQKKGKGRNRNNKGEPTDKDVYLWCTDSLYTKVTGYLHDGCGRARTLLFQSVG